MNTSSLSEFRDFLDWLRVRTEVAWSRYKPKALTWYLASKSGGVDWQNGTRWTGGLSDSEIRAIEREFDLAFPLDYRLFLSTLGATDRPQVGARFADGGRIVPSERLGFYDWRRDKEEIRRYLEWPIEGICFDVENNELWLTDWDARPASKEDRRARIRALIAEAPRLIPVYGHRYLLAHDGSAGNPVLSVYQSDIIVYGADLLSYLISGFSDLVNMDEVSHMQRALSCDEFQALSGVPFWGDLIS